MEYTKFVERLGTFNVATWAELSNTASPLVCARCGWSNVALHVLGCDVCGARLPIVRGFWKGKEDGTEGGHMEDVLLKKHREGCRWRRTADPLSFMHLQLKPLESVSGEFLDRFDALNVLWDLPKVKNFAVEDETEEDLRMMFAFLYDRQTKRLRYQSTAEWDEALKGRVRSQTLLALLGWRVTWAERLVYMEDTTDSRCLEFTEGMSNDPVQTHIGFGRQAILTCALCSARRVLWTFQTQSELSRERFLEMSKKLVLCCDASPLIGIKRRREEEEREKKAVATNPRNLRKPAFGLKSFKRVEVSKLDHLVEPQESKVKTVDEKHRLSAESFSECHPVVSPFDFRPVDEHRYFCPWKNDWNRLLKALTGT